MSTVPPVCVRAGCFHPLSSHNADGSCQVPNCFCVEFAATRETMPSDRLQTTPSVAEAGKRLFMDSEERARLDVPSVAEVGQRITMQDRARFSASGRYQSVFGTVYQDPHNDHHFAEAPFYEGQQAIHVVRKIDEEPAPTNNLRQPRDARQRALFEWGVHCFGMHEAGNSVHRGIRFGEEAIELMQALAVPEEMVHNLVSKIYAKEPGEVAQEMGGVGVTLLILAEALKLSAEECEIKEVMRVLSRPAEHFRARNRAKNEAGFRAPDVVTP